MNDEPIASDVERINSANDGADLVETNADDTEGAENDVAQGSTDVDGLTALQSASEDLVGRWIGDKPDCLLEKVDVFLGDRSGELAFRRDGEIGALSARALWKLEYQGNSESDQLILVIDREMGATTDQCRVRIEVTSRSIRFLNSDGRTEYVMNRAE